MRYKGAATLNEKGTKSKKPAFKAGFSKVNNNAGIKILVKLLFDTCRFT